jgi:MoaA/NifB/PqqE/SkfB family radical SAM enzyme
LRHQDLDDAGIGTIAEIVSVGQAEKCFEVFRGQVRIHDYFSPFRQRRFLVLGDTSVDTKTTFLPPLMAVIAMSIKNFVMLIEISPSRFALSEFSTRNPGFKPIFRKRRFGPFFRTNKQDKEISMNIAERIDAHTHVPRERLVETPPFPDSIKIEVTSRCNYKCSFCAAGAKLRCVGDMDPAFLFRILKEAKATGVKEIGLFLLGESFLLKRLPEYIRYAKEEAGIEYVFLTTNGSLCKPARLEAVIDAGLDSLKFSVNAPTREKYEAMHGVDCFDRVMENIRWLGERRKQPGFSMKTAVSSIYVEEDAEALERLREEMLKYVDDFYLLPYYNQAGHVEGHGVVGNPGRWGNMVSPIPCWGLFNSAKISWNGWLTACYFDHDNRFEIADLNEVSLIDAWHHPKFAELRRQHLCGDVSKSVCAECLGCRK